MCNGGAVGGYTVDAILYLLWLDLCIVMYTAIRIFLE